MVVHGALRETVVFRDCLCLISVETLFFQKGTYLPQTYIIQEEMIATEHVSDMEQLGSFIYRLCSGKETYRLRRRGARRRESLRAPESP